MKVIAISCALVMFFSATVSADWTEFRGRGSTSIGTGQPPERWDEKTNIAWVADLPGRGLSGPIVVNGQVILTASSGSRGDRLHVLSFDEKTGQLQWHRQFWATGNLSCHPKMCMATPTPATDGQRIVAFYSTNDLFCLDLAGNTLWVRGLTHDYPNASNSVGMSSSPVIVGDAVIVDVENEGDSFLAGIDMATGENLWKEKRPKAALWTSPVAVRGDSPADDLVLTQGGDAACLRQPRTGEVVWKLDRACSSVPTAAIDRDVAYIPCDGTVAVKLEAGGKPEVLWEQKLLRSGTPSPIVHEGRVYVINSAILTCGEAATGKILWKLRLRGSFSGTPIIAANRLYAFSEEGVAFVIDLSGSEGRIVAENLLGKSADPAKASEGETILCSPALVGDAIFVRSDGHLWKIAKTE